MSGHPPHADVPSILQSVDSIPYRAGYGTFSMVEAQVPPAMGAKETISGYIGLLPRSGKLKHDGDAKATVATTSRSVSPITMLAMRWTPASRCARYRPTRPPGDAIIVNDWPQQTGCFCGMVSRPHPVKTRRFPGKTVSLTSTGWAEAE
jgi:hypothetical protein